jgi:hypothetical protein
VTSFASRAVRPIQVEMITAGALSIATHPIPTTLAGLSPLPVSDRISARAGCSSNRLKRVPAKNYQTSSCRSIRRSNRERAKMSDGWQGPGWWCAADGNWYPPECAPVAPAPKKIAPVRVALMVLVLLAAWGAYAIQQNANGGHLPLGPVGGASCSNTIRQAQANVPNVISQAQSNIDGMGLDPATAAAAKQDLANSQGQVQQDLANTGHQLGC